MSESLHEYAEPAPEMTEAMTHEMTDDMTGDMAGPETTGDAAVDAVVASLRGLDDVPVAEHVAVFERAHESLRQVLSGAGEPVQVSRS